MFDSSVEFLSPIRELALSSIVAQHDEIVFETDKTDFEFDSMAAFEEEISFLNFKAWKLQIFSVEPKIAQHEEYLWISFPKKKNRKKNWDFLNKILNFVAFLFFGVGYLIVYDLTWLFHIVSGCENDANTIVCRSAMRMR